MANKDSTGNNDRTILVPRPGGRLSQPSSADGPGNAGGGANIPLPNNDSDRTIIPSQINSNMQRQTNVPGIGSNPILDGAATSLSLLAQIRNTPAHQDIKVLHQQCIELIRDFEHQLRAKDLDQESLYSARYCLCAILDETVLNTPWGANSFWAMDSLLSAYHKETLGGEHFFKILDEALLNPQKHIYLIEFQYLCLSLGFEGRLRLEERGATKLDELRERVYRVIRDTHGEYERELSPGWKVDSNSGNGLVDRMPIWVIYAILAALLLTSFMAFRFTLNNDVHPSVKRLHGLVQTEQKGLLAEPSQLDRLMQLKQLLQSEIERGYLTVLEAPGKIVIRLNSESLFPSASANIIESFNPILKKVAMALESIPGRIIVIGHTDDVSILSYQFKSNFELSLERANSVVAVMKSGAQLSSRVISDGKADLEPLVPNSSEINRAQNRRVEINLMQY